MSLDMILVAVLTVVILMLGTNVGTEVVKGLSRLLGDKFGATWLKISGYSSYIVAVALGVYVSMGYDVNAFEVFGLNVDPELLKVFTGLFSAFFASKLHDAGE